MLSATYLEELAPSASAADDAASSRKLVRRQKPEQISVLCVSPDPQDLRTLRRVLDSTWQVAAVATCRECAEWVQETSVSVIVCESRLEDGTWKDVLENSIASGHGPLVIVTSRLADALLWSEVLNLGGHDVLAKPFDEEEVRRVLNAALLQKQPAVQSMHAGSAA
jgi:DNA-binding NtrC family response regulator